MEKGDFEQFRLFLQCYFQSIKKVHMEERVDDPEKECFLKTYKVTYKVTLFLQYFLILYRQTTSFESY